jgi:phytanoyl-CoA hydroxylase
MSMTQLGPAGIAARLYKFDRTHAAVAHPSQLTDADFRRYHEDGFLAVNNVFTPAEVQAAKEGLSHLINGGNPQFTGVEFETELPPGLTADEKERYVRKLMWFVDHDARLGAMVANETFLKIVRRCAGEDVRMIQDMALLKPPHIGREKPWHQDTAYFLYEPLTAIVGTWTALDAATAANGCMHMIPGSHAAGPKPHYHDRDCQLPDEEIDVDRDVMVPLEPGGTVFFSGLIHHGTPPNQSGDRRRALQFHFAGVSAKKVDQQAHLGAFHDDKGYAGCTGWGGGLKTRRIEER